ncbi:MAG: redox-sensing transcriptional repressor Rex [Planctomycetota bacterium]
MHPQSDSLPTPAVGRLSLYFRELHRLIEQEVASINSKQLGELVNVTPTVVRRDLREIGSSGRRGVGYDTHALVEQIGRVLGAGVVWNVVLVGVGSLGNALLRYRGFERLGFRLAAALDRDPTRIGGRVGGATVEDAANLLEILRQRPSDLAILAVPAESAIEVAAELVGAGVRGILNFAPTTLRLPGDVAVVNVDLASELQRLAFGVQTLGIHAFEADSAAAEP